MFNAGDRENNEAAEPDAGLAVAFDLGTVDDRDAVKEIAVTLAGLEAVADAIALGRDFYFVCGDL